MTQFNDRLQRIRRVRLDITQAEFSDKIGVNRVTINKWERGTAKPQHDELVKIIKSLPQIDVRWLLTGEGNMIVFKGSKELAETKNKMLDLYRRIDVLRDQNFEYEKSIQECILKHPQSKDIFNTTRNDQPHD